MTYVKLEPEDFRHVRVRTPDGLWVDGALEAFRHVEGVWSGFVRYTLTPGDTRTEWFEEPRIRAASGESLT